MATGLALGQVDIVCLRAGPFSPSTPRGQFVAQSWYYQGQRAYIDRQAVTMELPAEAPRGEQGRTDPWFEFSSFRVVSVLVTQRGGMQRMPAEILGEAPDFLPFYAERCDGLLPGRQPGAADILPSFHVPGSSARSLRRPLEP
jgi:hypothetical protein